MRIPVLNLAAQHAEVQAEIDAAIGRVLAASAFIGGEEVRAFEREFAAYLGARHVIGVANGTDAIELALEAAGVGAGDSVVTVPFTFVSPVAAILRIGARPIFVDICPDEFTIDVDQLTSVLERQRVRAIVVVHLYGQPADLDRLLPPARAHGAVVIEDAAQAHGAWCTVGGRRRRVGAVGDFGCFSFYPTKNLGALGDAGAVVTDDDDHAARIRLLANHGDRGKYDHVAIGRNSRLDALQAAVLRVKLTRLDQWNAARRAVARRYAELLADLPAFLPYEPAGRESVYHQYALRLARRDHVRAALAERGIATAVHYPLAVHQQPAFRHLDAASFPVAEQCAAEVLSLPMFPHLNTDELSDVAASVRDALLSDVAAHVAPGGASR